MGMNLETEPVASLKRPCANIQVAAVNEGFGKSGKWKRPRKKLRAKSEKLVIWFALGCSFFKAKPLMIRNCS